MKFIFFITLILLSACDSKISTAQEKAVSNKSVAATVNAYPNVEEYIKNLRGIEYYFIELTKNKPDVTVEKVRLLMLQNNKKLPPEIEK